MRRLRFIRNRGDLFLLVIGVLVGSPAANGVTVVWDRNPEPDVIGYNFFVRQGLSATTFAVGAEPSITLSNLQAGLTYAFYATAVNSAGLESDFSEELTYTVPSPASVIGRYILYNESAFDGNDATASTADDLAIAPNKSPLFQGQTASFTNYTSFHHGINGLVIDISGGLGGQPSINDFEFRVGNDNDPSGWPVAPTPSSVTLRRGAGISGADRITILWPNGAIQKQWLEVKVLPSVNTGLLSADIFYFGNAIGECGNSSADAVVDVSDENAARQNPRNFLNPAPISNVHDYNRDKRVDVSDENLARVHNSNFLNALRLIDLSSTPSALSATTSMQAASSLTSVEATPAGAGEPESISAPASASGPALRLSLHADGHLRLESRGTSLATVRVQATTDVAAGPWEDLPLALAEQITEDQLVWTIPFDDRKDRQFFRVLSGSNESTPIGQANNSLSY